MRLVVTAPRSELGRVMTAVPQVDGAAAGAVLVNLALQGPNTLLHDGRAWWSDPGAHILDSTRRALALARREDASLVVHASYAFLEGAEGGSPVGDRVRPIVDAARAAEEMVLEDGWPACVVRLGYLYGPGWHDLRAYRRAFRLGRPYWAGPPASVQHHLHSADAATALIAAASDGEAGGRTYATDGLPTPFATFMDHFARLVGRSHPLHVPAAARPLMRVVMRESHMQMVEMAATGPAAPQLPGWRPRLPSYRAGLADVLEAWHTTR